MGKYRLIILVSRITRFANLCSQEAERNLHDLEDVVPGSDGVAQMNLHVHLLPMMVLLGFLHNILLAA
ncbi:hypothetical protein HanRHA438_Chr15g0723781 [Helianthus annuus]|nr:hypothetical protein HanIR_Chr15g0774311 [Helianthus annuus]KAJ0846344.1 hypothetical protein HanRHA438_Chr15g0723781 [Helianthus annuus]